MAGVPEGPRTVLHVIGTLQPGGVEMWLLSLFGETGRLGVRSTVCALGEGPGSLESAAAELGVGVLRCPLEPSVTFPRRFLAALRRLRPHVLHSHVHLASGWLLWLGRRAGVPVRIAHSHTTEDGRRPTPKRRLYRGLSRRLIWRHATAGVAASDSAGEALFGERWRSDARFRIIHNGIDLSRFSSPADPGESRRALGFPEDATVVGHVGRFHPVKNQAFFLEVAEVLARRDAQMRFLLVGEGPLRPDIERMAGDRGLRHLFVLAGGAEVDVPGLLMGAVDLVLFPSLWEGLPVTLIEAQAAGLRILASASITPEVAVVPGLVRFSPLQAGAEAWADEVQAALSAPAPSREDAHRTLARSDFNIHISARGLSALYAAAAPVGGRSPLPPS